MKSSKPHTFGCQFTYNWIAVFLAAALASVAITLYMFFLPRTLGIESMDIGITIGAMADPDGGTAAFLARVGWHMGNGVFYVLLYATILLAIPKQSTIGTGLLFGVCLWLAGPMTLIPLLLDLHPHMGSAPLTNPGIFMLALDRGWTPAAIDLGAHLIHGALAGAVYKHHAV